MKIKIIFQDAGDSPDAPQPREMIDMEATFEKLEHAIKHENRGPPPRFSHNPMYPLKRI
jgi:hypothetical protein